MSNLRLGEVFDAKELCLACDGLSPRIAMDGETIMHCPVLPRPRDGYRRGGRRLAAGGAGKIRHA
jgi:hypothetical protein